MLLHSAINNTKDIVPSVVAGAANPLALSPSRSAWITVALLWVCAAFFAWQMRGVFELGDAPGAPPFASVLNGATSLDR
jgi:hypothetical protein